MEIDFGNHKISKLMTDKETNMSWEAGKKVFQEETLQCGTFVHLGYNMAFFLKKMPIPFVSMLFTALTLTVQTYKFVLIVYNANKHRLISNTLHDQNTFI